MEMKKPKKIIRWKAWDYSSAGAYFVTICTQNWECSFGEIRHNLDFMDIGLNADSSIPYPHLHSYMRPTTIAEIAWRFWKEIPSHYPFVVLDAFVIMPNHIHGILFFDKEPNEDWNPYQFGPQRNNLADVIRAYKGSVKRWANKKEIPFSWQGRYHDRVIRNVDELKRIQTYIWNNPFNWNSDQENPDYRL
jgi:REP element-mobilizing transposase RayT